MKTMKKITGFMMAAALMASVISGCGPKEAPVTVESLMEGASATMEESKSMEGAMLMEVAMEMTAGDQKQSMSIVMDMDLKTTTDPQASYMAGKMTMDMGATITMDMENYVVQEDGKYVSYTGAQDIWTKVESDSSEFVSAADSNVYKTLAQEAETKLAEQTETINEKECYVVTSKVSGETMKSLMAGSDELLESFNTENLDYSALTADVTVYIGKEDKKPVCMIMDMSSLFKEMFSQLIPAESGNVDIQKANFRYDFTSFDTVDAITVPEDVKASAAEA